MKIMVSNEDCVLNLKEKCKHKEIKTIIETTMFINLILYYWSMCAVIFIEN